MATAATYPTAEQLKAYREEIRAVVPGEIEELVQGMELTRKAPTDLWERLARRDLLRLTLPEEYGGWGLRLGDYEPILEVVAQSHGSVRMVVHLHNGLWRLLHRHGSPAQKERFLRAWGTGRVTEALDRAHRARGGARGRTEAAVWPIRRSGPNGQRDRLPRFDDVVA